MSILNFLIYHLFLTESYRCATFMPFFFHLILTTIFIIIITVVGHVFLKMAAVVDSELSLLRVIAGGMRLSKAIFPCQSQLDRLGVEILRHQNKLLTHSKVNGEECKQSTQVSLYYKTCLTFKELLSDQKLSPLLLMLMLMIVGLRNGLASISHYLLPRSNFLESSIQKRLY
jgi:hypothetical protein